MARIRFKISIGTFLFLVFIPVFLFSGDPEDKECSFKVYSDSCYEKLSESLRISVSNLKNHKIITREAGEEVLVKIYFNDDITISKALSVLQQNSITSKRKQFGYVRYLEALVPVIKIENLAKEDSVTQIIKLGLSYIYPVINDYGIKNESAAKLSRVDEIKFGGASGYNLTGQGIKIGLWEGENARQTHVDLAGRIILNDFFVFPSSHATHVAGTIIGSGAGNIEAQGMALASSLINYNWINDTSEMASASKTISVSNHSYAVARGWYFDGYLYHWYGDTEIDVNEDYMFGKYDDTCVEWDEVVYSTDLMIVTGAGNDRLDSSPPAGTPHTHKGSGIYYCMHAGDAENNEGYDTIPQRGTAKNILTIGAVDSQKVSSDADTGFTMSNFSSWGPTDDGRIKPDIVAKGVGIFSCNNGNDNDYTIKSGTSMSAPVVTGVVALLQEQYANLLKPKKAKAALMRGLLIHTATDDNETAGPDCKYGYGLLNARAAADFIKAASLSRNPMIIEDNLYEESKIYIRQSDGILPVTVTLSWIDPPGSANLGGLDDSTPALVNNLDVCVIAPDGEMIYPWSLNPKSPALPASNKSPNNTDNIEKIEIPDPLPGLYQIKISCSSQMTNTPQSYVLLCSGFKDNEAVNLSFIDIDDLGDGDNNIEKGEIINLYPMLSYRGANPVQHVFASIETDRPDEIEIKKPVCEFTDFQYIPPVDPNLPVIPNINNNLILKTGTTFNDYYEAEPFNPISVTLKSNFSFSKPLRIKLNVFSTTSAYTNNLYYSLQCGEIRYYNYSTPAKGIVIPDNSAAGIENHIFVGDNFIISEAEISIDIQHSYIGDLTVEVISPGGKTITLHNKTGLEGENLIKTYSLANPPDGPGTMKDFCNILSKGLWTLKITDHSSYNSGILNSWNIKLKTYINNVTLSTKNSWQNYE